MDNKKKYLFAGSTIVILVIILGILVTIAINGNDANLNLLTSNNTESITINTDVEAKEKRGESSYSEYDATINLSTFTSSSSNSGVVLSGTTITITKAGIYYFTGTANEANIVINAGDDDNVVLVFENANITCSTTAVVNGVNAKNVYINLKEGSTNTFTDSSSYSKFTEDDEPDATVFSKTDLIINGTGTLIINANYKDGIASKDDLVITNATLKITAKDDGIRGKDCVDIKDAFVTINADGDGIKSTNEKDGDKGYVIIDGGTIDISAGDDGIHAETVLKIESGTINITKSYEGLEGTYIEINGGKINVLASDDGINASDGSGSSEFGGMLGNSNTNSNVGVVINGGDIYVNAQGDGLDANGYIKQTGGNVVIVGTTSNGNGALDYDSTFEVTGGNLIVYGATGMWQNPSTSSSQYSICFSQSGSSGDKIEVKDSSGNTITSFTTEKSYSAILISNSNIKNGETYTLYVNGSQVKTLQVSSIVTSQVSGEGNMMGGMPNGGAPGGNQGNGRR